MSAENSRLPDGYQQLCILPSNLMLNWYPRMLNSDY